MNNDVLIFGSGSCALRTAQNLTRRRIRVHWVASEHRIKPWEGINLLAAARLIHCDGYAGAFDLEFQYSGGILKKRVGAIALAFEEKREPKFSAYGLSPSTNVQDLTTVERRITAQGGAPLFKTGRQVAFLNGWLDDSQPAVTSRMLALCLRLQKQDGVQTFFITGNLKVAGPGLERICQETKAAGTVFVKCTDRFPETRILPGGRIQFDYWDEITRDSWQLQPDFTVVDESLKPDPVLNELAALLCLEQDPDGFAQGDNVRRLSNMTNRRGIFTAGASRAVFSAMEKDQDADNLALGITMFLSDGDQDNLPRAEIHRGRCARCLTCHRLCPHWAINIGARISVVPQACQSCGICAAGCPARAIEMPGVLVDEGLRQLGYPPAEHRAGDAFDPRLAVFCCLRSAGQAKKLAIDMGRVLPTGARVIEVPCGGAIAMHHLLAAFDAGVDGVLLCTCHQDNCQSRKGSSHARKRADAAIEMLNKAGMSAERLRLHTVAANMGTEFFEAVVQFHDALRKMGPWV